MEQKTKDKLYTKRQQLVIDDFKGKQPRHIIMHGAVRSGKTYLGIMLWVAYVKRHKGCLFIMTGYTISSLKRNVLDDIEKLFGIDTKLNINNEFKMFGNTVACFGSDKADSYKAMRGQTAQGWYANEVTLGHINSVLEAFARCSANDARIFWETNPDKPKHYIKTNYIDESGVRFKDGKHNIIAYHFKLEDNDRLDGNYVESLKRAIPEGTLYDRQILGLWKATERAIYTNYDEVDVEPLEHKLEDTVYGLDFGFKAPSALAKCSFIGKEVYVTGMFQKSGLTESMLIQECEKAIQDKSRPIYCDNAEPDKIQALKNAGFNALGCKKGFKEVTNKVREFKLHLVRGDADLIRQFDNYEHKTNASGDTLDEPVKYDDHYCDSVGYAIYTHMGARINIKELEDLFVSEKLGKGYEV